HRARRHVARAARRGPGAADRRRSGAQRGRASHRLRARDQGRGRSDLSQHEARAGMTDPIEPSVRALAELIARVAELLHAGGDDAAARAQAAADVEQMQAVVAQVQGTPGNLAGGGIAQIAGALRVFAEWLRTPTSANEAKAERAMSELMVTVGPLVGWDPA